MSKTTKTQTLDNIAYRRIFLEGPASDHAQTIIDGGGVLTWQVTSGGHDPQSQIDEAVGLTISGGRIDAVLDEIGIAHDTDERDAGYAALMNLTTDTAERAYLIGMAVGLRLRGER